MSQPRPDPILGARVGQSEVAGALACVVLQLPAIYELGGRENRQELLGGVNDKLKSTGQEPDQSPAGI